MLSTENLQGDYDKVHKLVLSGQARWAKLENESRAHMKMRSLLTVAALVSVLSACGGSGNNSTVQGVQSGSTKFSVNNNVGQAFASASVISENTGTSLYQGQFNCAVGQTCALGIETDSREGFRLEFYNSDGELVAAWSSNRPPGTYHVVNASHANLGAYLLTQMAKPYKGSRSAFIGSLKQYAIAMGAKNVDEIDTYIGQSHHLYTLQAGTQNTNEFIANVDLGRKKNQPSALTSFELLNSPSALGSSEGLSDPVSNCTGLEHTLAGAGGLKGIAEYFEIPYVGTIASVVGGYFTGVCEDTFKQSTIKQLNSISSKLGDIENRLKSIELSQSEILNELKALASYLATGNIQDKYLAFTTELTNNHNKVQEYLNILTGDPKNQYTSLSDFFAKTGGLDKDSLQGGNNPNKAAIQRSAIALLDSLNEQKRILDVLGSKDRYIELKTHLDKLCKTTENAQGDMFVIRHMCNGIILDLQMQLVAETATAAIMLKDELSVIDSVKGKVNFASAFDVSSGVEPVVLKIQNNAVAGVNLLQPYKLLDGFSADLLSSIMSQDRHCSENVGSDITLPSIVAWYPTTNPTDSAVIHPMQPFQPYAVTHCESAYGRKAYSKFYYGSSTSVRNVMGVLVDSSVSYTGGVGYQATQTPYTSTGSKEHIPTGEKDYFYLSPTSDGLFWGFFVNNAQNFCEGLNTCAENVVPTPDTTPTKDNMLRLNMPDGSLKWVFTSDWKTSTAPQYAVAALDDVASFNSNGDTFRYLIGFKGTIEQGYDHTCYNQANGSQFCVDFPREQVHKYYLLCLTQDCFVMGDQATIGFNNGGPAFNMSSPANKEFNFQPGPYK